MLEPRRQPPGRGLGGAGEYERHRPEASTLYQVLQHHWRTFEAQLDLTSPAGQGLPPFVREEFEAYLRCGILAHGFVRVRCGDCAASRLVAFSCKRRGFCPSCIGRRMSETAAHLVDRVLPEVPVRQWVLTVPHGLRYAMAHDPDLATVVLRVFLAEVTAWMRRRMRRQRIAGVKKTGAVTVIQRFDSALALNVHFHSLVFDGLYARDGSGRLLFHPAPAPDDEDVAEVAGRVYRKVARLFDPERDGGASEVREPAMAALAAASLRRFVATGARRGSPVRRLGAGRAPTPRLMGRRCAEVEGFNVHANTRIAANDRLGLEALCRYIARPPVSNERLAERADGNVTLRLKRPWSDGTTHLLLSPGELIEKLIPLIPRPRAHITRYHGVLAPASGWRAEVVPRARGMEGEGDASGASGAPPERNPSHIPWAELLMRVFRLDVLRCDQCGGRMKVLAAIMDPRAAAAILEHVGLGGDAPVVAPARGPPDREQKGAEWGQW